MSVEARDIAGSEMVERTDGDYQRDGRGGRPDQSGPSGPRTTEGKNCLLIAQFS
jgi:hypothetical protein